MSSNNKKPKKTLLTVDQKTKIIYECLLKDESKRKIAERFGISVSTLYGILKNKDVILKLSNTVWGRNQIKRPRAFNAVRVNLTHWFVGCCERTKTYVDDRILKTTAERIAGELGYVNFTATDKWLKRWKIINRIDSKETTNHGGNQPALQRSNYIEWLNAFWRIIGQRSPDDVYSVTETGLVFDLSPGQAFGLAGGARGWQEEETCERRITVLLGSNMSGTDRIRPLVIGCPAAGCCCPGVETGYALDYASGENAWMTNELFERWLSGFDAKMRSEGRTIALFLSNSFAHNVPARKLNAIEIEYLPPNAAPLWTQPMDRGVVQNFRTLYRKEVLRKTARDIRRGRPFSVDLSQAVGMCAAAWRQVRQETLAGCFAKSKTLRGQRGAADDDDEGGAVDADDGGHEWTVMVDHFGLKPEHTFRRYVETDADVPSAAGILDDQGYFEGTAGRSFTDAVGVVGTASSEDVLVGEALSWLEVERTEDANEIFFEYFG